MHAKYLPHAPNLGLLALRIPLALTFLFHGAMKLGNMTQTIAFLGSLGVPPFMAWVVAIVEVVGGLCVLTGVFARKAGWLLAVNMLVAIILVKAGAGFVGGFEYELMLLGASLAVALIGPGTYVLFSGHCCDGHEHKH